jgi:uncharacterized protein (TIGR03000 family)
MYTVVVMAALGGAVDLPDCGRHRRGGGCSGCYGGGCYGGCYGGGGCWGGGCYGGGYYSGGCYGGGCYGGGSGYAYGGYSRPYGYAYTDGMTYPGGQPYISGYYAPATAMPVSADVTRQPIQTQRGEGVPTGRPVSTPDRVPVAPTPRNPDRAVPPMNSTKATGEAPATILVSLPAGARLLIGDELSRSTSADRVFVSPPLRPGKSYSYALKAELSRDGQTLTTRQDVAVRAGQVSRVSIQFPDELARR